MKVWSVQNAKARFSEMLDACSAHGPQLVTKRGIEAAFLVPADEWRRLQKIARPTLKDLLLSPDARGDIAIPGRGHHTRRNTPSF